MTSVQSLVVSKFFIVTREEAVAVVNQGAVSASLRFEISLILAIFLR